MTIRSRSVFSLNRVSMPPENPLVNSKINYLELQHTHSDILKVLNLCVTKILSPLVGTSLNVLSNILRVEYGISTKLYNDFVKFISIHDLNCLEFETSPENNNVRLPIIFATPRQKVSVIGNHSLWMPSHKEEI
jgi:hypothetical protein